MNYQARCHCGRVRFSFRCGEIRTGARCDCWMLSVERARAEQLLLKDGYRVNLGCVEGLDTFALEIRRIDGRSVPLVDGHANIPP